MNALLKFGELNPQAVREFKGRLKGRNVAIAIVTSIVTQGLLLLSFFDQIPTLGSQAYSSYCIQDGSGYCVAVDWSRWWFDLFEASYWILPLVLVTGGVYLLIDDLAKEERRGTLNFIRLTPQSSQSILLGKIVGVPVLIYLAAILYLPLFAIAGISAGLTPLWLVGYILVLGIASFFLYSAALLFVFLKGEQAWLGSLVAAYLMSSLLTTNFVFFDLQGSSLKFPNLQWFFFPIGRSFGFYQTFVLASIGIGCYWIWQALNRRFRNPNSTILSKAHSYSLVACAQLWVLGFAVQVPTSTTTTNDTIAVATGLNILGFLLVMAAITPHFQTSIDWARYRHTMAYRQSLWRDLVWGEKSPAIVAIAINLGIMLVIWGAWVLSLPDGMPKWQSLASLLLGANLILVYSAIAQSFLMLKTSKRAVWATASILATLGIPPVCLYIIFGDPATSTLSSLVSGLWLASTAGASGFALESASLFSVGLAILAQWSIFGLLTLKLSRQLQQAGASPTKALMGTSSITHSSKA